MVSATVSAMCIDSQAPLICWESWRRRPDLNRGWRFCRPLPYLLATAPLKHDAARSGPRVDRRRVSSTNDAAVLSCTRAAPAKVGSPPEALGSDSVSPPSLARHRVASFGGHPSPAAESEGWSGKRDSNPRLRPWQGRTLPLSYSRPTSQSTTRPGWLSSVDVSTDTRLKPSRPWFSLSDRCRTQHLRRLLGRRRIDGETRSPVEPGHP